jgi:hypothetical protein
MLPSIMPVKIFVAAGNDKLITTDQLVPEVN